MRKGGRQLERQFVTNIYTMFIKGNGETSKGLISFDKHLR